MIFGICKTKHGENVDRYFSYIAKGLRKLKYKYIFIETPYDFRLRYKSLDAFFMYGWYDKRNSTPSVKIRYRQYIHKLAKQSKKPLFVMDTGFLPNYYAIALNGVKGVGQFYADNSPNDRFKEIEQSLNIKPWRTYGSHILVLGQRKANALCPGIDLNKWHLNICKRLRAITNKEIHFRVHPRAKRMDFKLLRKVAVIKKNTTLKEDLENCWAAVGLTTNALFECLLEGIPIFPLHENSFFFQLGNNNVDHIMTPTLFDRQQFFNNTMYCQWTLDEIATGYPIKRLLNCHANN